MNLTIEDIYKEVAEFLGINYEEALTIRRNLDWERGNLREWESKKSIESYYGKTYYYLFHLAEKTLHPNEWTLPILELLSNPKLDWVKVIHDYGCGCGQDALEVGKKGYDIIISDIPSLHFDFAKWKLRKNNIRFIAVDVVSDTQEFPCSDFTICLAVMEHLKNPVVVLRNILSYTKSIMLKVDPTWFHPQHLKENSEVLIKMDGDPVWLRSEFNLVRAIHSKIPFYIKVNYSN